MERPELVVHRYRLFTRLDAVSGDILNEFDAGLASDEPPEGPQPDLVEIDFRITINGFPLDIAQQAKPSDVQRFAQLRPKFERQLMADVQAIAERRLGGHGWLIKSVSVEAGSLTLVAVLYAAGKFLKNYKDIKDGALELHKDLTTVAIPFTIQVWRDMIMKEMFPGWKAMAGERGADAVPRDPKTDSAPESELLDVIKKLTDVVKALRDERSTGSRISGLPHRARFKESPIAPEMVVIDPPEKRFQMGSPEDETGRADWEGPQHPVTIEQKFALGRYVVTFDEYEAFCRANYIDPPGDEGWGRGRRPVINVSWDDVQDYLAWLNEELGLEEGTYRLPSEAEWEFACRAGTETRYAFGDELTAEMANFGQNVGKTVEVGSYPANGWGLHDMHGNVWEWCADPWHYNYVGAPDDGSVWPMGGEESRRIARGGSWVDGAEFCRSAFRIGRVRDGRNDIVGGFRIARTIS